MIRKKMLAVSSFYGEKRTPERTTTVCLSHMRNAYTISAPSETITSNIVARIC